MASLWRSSRFSPWTGSSASRGADRRNLQSVCRQSRASRLSPRDRVHQRFEEHNFETPRDVGLVAPLTAVNEAFERIAQFSPENLNIFSSSPLFLAVTRPGARATVHGDIWNNFTIFLREGGARAVRTWKSGLLQRVLDMAVGGAFFFTAISRCFSASVHLNVESQF